MNAGNAPTDRVVALETISDTADRVSLDSDIVLWSQQMPLRLPSGDLLEFPVRVDATLIAVCTRGRGHVTIDMSEYEVKENTLLVLHPQHFLDADTFEEGTELSIMACSRKVVEEILPKLTDLLPLLLHYHSQPVIQLSEEEAEGIKAFYRFIGSRLEKTPSPYRRQKMLCLLQATLYEMMDLNSMPDRKKPEARTRRDELMARFLLAVGEHYRTHREVRFYSDALCITPKHLSTVVKSVSGRTPGDWIESYVIMEAKMLLSTTDLSIQEIASQLNFPNQSFFGKYFRHQTGLSPSAFRKNPDQ